MSNHERAARGCDAKRTWRSQARAQAHDLKIGQRFYAFFCLNFSMSVSATAMIASTPVTMNAMK